jgi:hypothetical protein
VVTVDADVLDVLRSNKCSDISSALPSKELRSKLPCQVECPLKWHPQRQ